MTLIDTFTSTGRKMFYHQEAMKNLRNGKGQPIVAHVMPTDVCNHTCAFCSVQHRAGDALTVHQIRQFLDQLVPLGLKAVILSGGGNPILYRCKMTGARFDYLVEMCRQRDLEVGLISNGLSLKEFTSGRLSWKTVPPRTLDELAWVRVSMAGLDHVENSVEVPDVDPERTVLGFSYVAHDIYDAPEDIKHGKVSTEADVLRLGSLEGREVKRFEDRRSELTEHFINYCVSHQPRYLRLLPNCLEPDLIPKRYAQLTEIAAEVNRAVKQEVAFVQYKPPSAPKACYLGYVHPVLNCDGYVYPCDSCVLNEKAGHQFATSWRVCRWDEVGDFYKLPVRSLIKDPATQCPGCVFPRTNELLGGVVDGTADLTPPKEVPEHANFV